VASIVSTLPPLYLINTTRAAIVNINAEIFEQSMGGALESIPRLLKSLKIRALK
jgi:hypothetical protein